MYNKSIPKDLKIFLIIRIYIILILNVKELNFKNLELDFKERYLEAPSLRVTLKLQKCVYLFKKI